MENTNSSSKGYLFPLVVIGVLFFMIGFALGINGLIIPFLWYRLGSDDSRIVSGAGCHFLDLRYFRLSLRIDH